MTKVSYPAAEEETKVFIHDIYMYYKVALRMCSYYIDRFNPCSFGLQEIL